MSDVVYRFDTIPPRSTDPDQRHHVRLICGRTIVRGRLALNMIPPDQQAEALRHVEDLMCGASIQSFEGVRLYGFA